LPVNLDIIWSLIVCSPRNICTASIPDFAELIYVNGRGRKVHPDTHVNKIIYTFTLSKRVNSEVPSSQVTIHYYR
jgi:hypothetical protein